jgi:ParB family chromosome partitioning protein
MALVENIQREDLNAMEVAISYKRLMEECSLSKEQLGDVVGKNRTTVTNYLRLLRLPAEIQAAIQDEKITMGQARPLINLKEEEMQTELLHEIIRENLSSRAIEQRVKEINEGIKKQDQGEESQSKAKKKQPLPRRYTEIKESLAGKLETEIKLSRNNKGKGNIVITFESDEDLERILALIDK